MSLASYGQESKAPPQKGEEQAGRTEKDFKVQVAVEEVRLDAVVLDKNGRQITDLAADDFEIYQDDFRQKVTACKYVTDVQAQPGIGAVPSRDSKAAPPIPGSSMLTKESVRRVIVFVLDDLDVSFETIHYMRMAAKNFVETQMQPGDLVAILQTSGGISSLQSFSSEKRHLLAMINDVRWGNNMQWGSQLNDTQDYLWKTNFFGPQVVTIRFCIRALRDMPGRKSVLLLTTRTTMGDNAITNLSQAIRPNYGLLYLESFRRLADEALRAGVVIHTMDARGLGVDSPSNTGETRLPLSQKTGGLFLENSNFFVTRSGIGRVNEELKGYYLLSYTPPSSTFNPARRGFYHRIKIKVKRPGSQVHARDGFYGIAQPSETMAGDQNPLRDVIFSPFRYNDLKVNLASGYIDDAQKGYLLRSWLHLDAKNLFISDEEDGSHTISLGTLCVTSDINNSIRDVSNPRYLFGVKNEDISWIREHGIRFSTYLPVKKPGAYYVRAAVKDQVSGTIGSAYQFIEIPDLKKRRLTLSNLFVINLDEDASWVQSRTMEESKDRFYPILRRDASRSPALRSYLPGESLEYMAVIYNAKSTKGLPPDLESQYVLYRNGAEIFKGEPESVDLAGTSDFTRIPIRKKLLLENTLQSGDYVLQFQVRDKQAKKKQSLASQTMSFEILEQQSAVGSRQ